MHTMIQTGNSSMVSAAAMLQGIIEEERIKTSIWAHQMMMEESVCEKYSSW